MVEETAHPRWVTDPCGSEDSLVQRVELTEPDPLHTARLVVAALRTIPVVRYDPVTPDDAGFRNSKNAQDFFELLRDELAPRSRRVRLRPGESVVWDDSAVLHGRDAFAASRADERLLWKAGVRLDPSRTPA